MKKNRKTRWLLRMIVVLAACTIAGLILSVILFKTEGRRTYASTSIQFSFSGASEGKAPNGYPLDVSSITSDEVIENALVISGFNDKYTADDIRGNLSVVAVYPEDIVDQMTRYTSLLDTKSEQQAALTDFHTTEYALTLYSDFDPRISGKDLTGLLTNLVSAYRTYFAKTASPSLSTVRVFSDLSSYDYVQQLAAIREETRQQGLFAEEMAKLAPDFRQGKKSFDDVVVSYSDLNNEIDRLNASVTINVISKNRERLQKQYEMELRNLGWELESKQAELKQVETLLDGYDKDAVVYVSTSGALQKVENNSSDTYDKLVTRRAELSDSITSSNAQIANLKELLEDMTPASKDEATDSEDTTVSEEELQILTEETEKKLSALSAKKQQVTASFSSMLDSYAAQQVNRDTLSSGSIRYRKPSLLSTAFISKAIKTTGPVCAVGFMICLVLVIHARRKQEKNTTAKA